MAGPTRAGQGCSSIMATSAASAMKAITKSRARCAGVAGRLDLPCQLVGQLRQVGGQGGEVV